MIIDFHTHIFPDKIAEATIQHLKSKANVVAYTNGTIGNLKASMQNAGIDYSVTLPIATVPKQTGSINLFASQITGKDGIISFGSIHPLYEDWKNELDRIKALGLVGIKLHPDYQQFFVDDEAILPMLQYATQLGLIIIFHGGVDIGIPGYIHCTPQRVKNLLKSLKGARLVIAHLGGYLCWDEVEKYLIGEDIYFDTSYVLGKISDEQFLRIIRNHGVEKILFATDSPWGNQAQAVKKIMSLPLTEYERSAIMHKNAEGLLGPIL